MKQGELIFLGQSAFTTFALTAGAVVGDAVARPLVEEIERGDIVKGIEYEDGKYVVLTDEEIKAAVDQPPQTTRAKLRGDFITAAQEAGRDFTVDWVHLKLNDQAQRTVLCKDPFRAVDERVDRLLELLASRPTPAGP